MLHDKVNQGDKVRGTDQVPRLTYVNYETRSGKTPTQAVDGLAFDSRPRYNKGGNIALVTSTLSVQHHGYRIMGLRVKL